MKKTTTAGEKKDSKKRDRKRDRQRQWCTSLTGFHGQQGCGETDVSPACGIIPKTKQNNG